MKRLRFPPLLPFPKIITDEWVMYFEYIQKKYDISEKDWIDAYKGQRGRCAICGKKRDQLVPDHCHKTKKFRGLLCHWCNGLLGKYEKHRNRILQYLNRGK